MDNKTGDCQQVFVGGRQIFYAASIANEVVDELEERTGA